MTPYEIADVGREIFKQEVQVGWLLDNWWWESYPSQNENELVEHLCLMTELWGIIEDLERKEKFYERVNDSNGSFERNRTAIKRQR
jgi:hypothetical protein